jgi:DNA replication and repair protein RecF
MHLTHLSLTHFRNFTRLDIDVPEGDLILVGGNAQGKTSLLEAIYFLATLESFHAGQDRQMINFSAAREEQPFARIVGTYFSGGDRHTMEVRLIQEPGSVTGAVRVRKEALWDGVKQRLSDVIGKFNAVMFLPQMMGVIEGSPDERRRYLNVALAQVISYYPGALVAYHRALTQRNALLKQLNERGGDPGQLSFWDDQLATYGAQIIYARIRSIQELELEAARTHRQLTRGSEILRLCYQPSYDPLPDKNPNQIALKIDTPVDRSRIPLEQIRAGFLEKLTRLHRPEIARGVTVIGPHRDELRFQGNGIDLGTYGSRGQVRTAMLSMKLAEVAWMKSKTGQWPVLLLDEVLAELDTGRRADLLSHLLQSEQVLMTTTDLDLFDPEFVGKSRLWKIEGGRISSSQ